MLTRFEADNLGYWALFSFPRGTVFLLKNSPPLFALLSEKSIGMSPLALGDIPLEIPVNFIVCDSYF